jgi:hypothetical protein
MQKEKNNLYPKTYDEKMKLVIESLYTTIKLLKLFEGKDKQYDKTVSLIEKYERGLISLDTFLDVISKLKILNKLLIQIISMMKRMEQNKTNPKYGELEEPFIMLYAKYSDLSVLELLSDESKINNHFNQNQNGLFSGLKKESGFYDNKFNKKVLKLLLKESEETIKNSKIKSIKVDTQLDQFHFNN